MVCTIHQPSSDICSLFDDAMLLSGGKMLYNGPWQEAETYMAVAGFGCASGPLHMTRQLYRKCCCRELLLHLRATNGSLRRTQYVKA